MQYSNQAAERLKRLGRARFTLTADISDYYGSIYTHSIEWALHTKVVAKASLRTKSKSEPKTLGASLDIAVRNGQEGQTKGLPVSPDTSLILGEIILCSLDAELATRFPGIQGQCLRFMDDLEFAARSRSEAEDVLLAWENLLGDYHLALNPRKTIITDGPQPPELPWRAELTQFRIRQRTDTVRTNDIYSFAARAFDLARKYPDSAVLNYALRKIPLKPLESHSWTAYEDLVYAIAIAEPSSLQIVFRSLSGAIQLGHTVNRDRACEVLNEICTFHAPLEHGYEVAWSLTLLRFLKLSLSSEAAAKVSAMRDNCCLLMLFDFIELGRVSGDIPDMTSAVTRAEHNLAPNSEDWLLGYECARNSWCKPDGFKSDNNWNELINAKIRFFRPMVKPEDAKSTVKRPTAPNGVQPMDDDVGDRPDAVGESPIEVIDDTVNDSEKELGFQYP